MKPIQRAIRTVIATTILATTAIGAGAITQATPVAALGPCPSLQRAVTFQLDTSTGTYSYGGALNRMTTFVVEAPDDKFAPGFYIQDFVYDVKDTLAAGGLWEIKSIDLRYLYEDDNGNPQVSPPELPTEYPWPLYSPTGETFSRGTYNGLDHVYWYSGTICTGIKLPFRLPPEY